MTRDLLAYQENVRRLAGYLKHWLIVLGTIASIAGITGLIIHVFDVKKKTGLELIYVTEITVFLVLLIVYVIIQEYRFLRKSRYADAMSSIHSCVHHLRDNHFENIDKDRDCKKALEAVVTSFANAFSLTTLVHCRACIKLIEKRNKSDREFQKLKDVNERVKYLYISTFCRDANTSSLQSKKPIDSRVHPVNGNTDFSKLYLNVDERCFFNNDLSLLSNYQNSSMTAGKELPYRSTIVWPIRRTISRQDEDTKGIFNLEQDIIGFLCVDSAKKNAFRKTYDFEMGAIVADSLFIFLKSYHKFLETKGGAIINGRKKEKKEKRF